MSHGSKPDTPVRVGVFSRVDQADHVISGLLAEGFSYKQISVLCSDQAKEKHFAGFQGHLAGETAPKRAAAGGVIGAALGGLATVAGFATTGGAAIAVAGHFLSVLVAGSIAGGFVGAMTSRGVDKAAADFYEQAVESGKILVVAEDHGEDAARKLRAAEIRFVKAGAEPIPLHAG